MDSQRDILKFISDFDEKASNLDINKLINEAIKFLVTKFDLHLASISIISPDKSGFTIFDKSTEIPGFSSKRFIPIEDSHLGEVIKNLTPLYRPDINQYQPKYEADQKLLKAGLKSDFIVPLLVKGNCLGTLNCGASKIDGISEYNQQLLTIIAPKLTMALLNAKLHETLINSENKYKNLLNSLDDLIFVLDTENRFISYYSPVDKLYYKPEVFIGKKYNDILPPDIIKKLDDVLPGVRKGKTAEFEYYFNMPEGKQWFAAKLSPMLENNKFTGTSVVSRDITERKKMEDDLKESEERYRSIFEGANDGILHLDNNLTVLNANPAFTEITGLDRTTIIGKKGFFLAEKFIDIKQLPPMLKFIKRMISNKPTESIELNFREKVLEISTRKQVSGEVVAVIRDITEHKQATETLKKSEQQYRNYFEKDISGVYLSTPQGKLIDCNPAFTKMTGYSMDEILEMNTSKLYPKPVDRSQFINHLTKYKFLIGSEIDLVKKDGQIIHCIENVIGSFNTLGELEQFQGYIFNITEQKKVEEELKKYQQHLEDLVKERTAELEEKNAELERFNSLFVGREFRIKELRDQVKELESKINN